MDEKHQKESNDDMSVWREDRKLVLHVLSENTEAIKELSKKLDSRSDRLTKMEARSGFFGSMGGIIGLLGFEWIRSLITKG